MWSGESGDRVPNRGGGAIVGEYDGGEIFDEGWLLWSCDGEGQCQYGGGVVHGLQRREYVKYDDKGERYEITEMEVDGEKKIETLIFDTFGNKKDLEKND